MKRLRLIVPVLEDYSNRPNLGVANTLRTKARVLRKGVKQLDQRTIDANDDDVTASSGKKKYIPYARTDQGFMGGTAVHRFSNQDNNPFRVRAGWNPRKTQASGPFFNRSPINKSFMGRADSTRRTLLGRRLTADDAMYKGQTGSVHHTAGGKGRLQLRQTVGQQVASKFKKTLRDNRFRNSLSKYKRHI